MVVVVSLYRRAPYVGKRLHTKRLFQGIEWRAETTTVAHTFRTLRRAQVFNMQPHFEVLCQSWCSLDSKATYIARSSGVRARTVLLLESGFAQVRTPVTAVLI